MIDTMLFYSVWKKISIVRALKRNFQLKFDVNLSRKRKINVKFVIESDQELEGKTAELNCKKEKLSDA